MRFLNSRFYSIAEVATNFFFLNILWLVMCIPIVTIFPATAAMFGVIRNWMVNKDTSVFRAFFTFFKENFKQSFIIGILWMLYIGVFYIDLFVLQQMDELIKTIFMSILLAIGLILAVITIHVFPIMVHFSLSFTGLVKNSLFFSLLYLPTSLLILVTVGAMIGILYIFPITLLFIFSVSAYAVYFLCHKNFLKVETLTKVNDAV
ncbi:YesL family protein [Bacillus sp. 1P02SD]|uniref:YesL family protein n=1 Tax=Bacillus sp. 1P02SD TaxID=3132264 RepID=UPI0039A1F3B6